MVAGDLVEGAEGLVHEQEGGVEGERAGDRHPLLHAAGELPGIFPLEAGEAHDLEPGPGALAALGGRQAHDLERQHHVPLDGAPGIEGRRLEHVAVGAREAGRLGRRAVDPQLARGRALEVGDGAQQGGLAAAGGADQGHELAGCDGEVHVHERLHRAVAGDEGEAQAASLDRRRSRVGRGRRAGLSSHVHSVRTGLGSQRIGVSLREGPDALGERGIAGTAEDTRPVSVLMLPRPPFELLRREGPRAHGRFAPHPEVDHHSPGIAQPVPARERPPHHEVAGEGHVEAGEAGVHGDELAVDGRLRVAGLTGLDLGADAVVDGHPACAISSTARSSTLAPASRWAGSAHSASLWLRPSLQGMKIIEVGTWRAV